MAVLYGDHMDAGDDQTGMRDHKDAGENSWVPQKCGTYELIEKRYHKYHNVVISVVLCVVISNRGSGLF
jgi:hypothetical protein